MLGPRHRLMLLTTAVMALVALASVCLGIWHVHHALDAHAQIPWIDGRLDMAERLVVGTALLAIIGGGSLLWRIVTPFAARLEASEARTEAIVAHAVEAIMTVDASGVVQSINPAGERLFGYEAAAVVGAHLKLLLPALAAEGVLVAPDEADETGAPRLRAEQGRRRDGRVVELELSVGQLPEAAPPLRIVVARDVTARREAEARLQAQAQELREANDALQTKSFELAQINREMNDFTYIATHDLKEPLRGIGAYCRMIREDSAQRLDAEGQARLATLDRLSGRLEMLVDDLLKFARAGCCRPEMERVELDELVADIVPTLAPRANGAAPRVSVTGALPAVRGDATMLGEVIRNLITNGLKFNQSPEPRVEIGAVAGAQPTIYVRDNGIGIAPEHHEAVFEMFRRLHARNKYDGTGAGLAIVRKLIKAHGGRVWLESTPGGGTTVWMTLPPAERRGDTPPALESLLAAPHFALGRAMVLEEGGV